MLVVASVAVPTAAQTIDGGEGHTVILKSDGTVWTMGRNSSGQLGDTTNNNSSVPVQVSGLTDVVAVAAGIDHSMAITSTGALYLWGANDKGQLGNTPGGPTDMYIREELKHISYARQWANERLEAARQLENERFSSPFACSRACDKWLVGNATSWDDPTHRDNPHPYR
jgi:hypothetical protein